MGGLPGVLYEWMLYATGLAGLKAIGVSPRAVSGVEGFSGISLLRLRVAAYMGIGAWENNWLKWFCGFLKGLLHGFPEDLEACLRLLLAYHEGWYQSYRGLSAG